jgi:hypothetical protein
VLTNNEKRVSSYAAYVQHSLERLRSQRRRVLANCDLRPLLKRHRAYLLSQLGESKAQVIIAGLLEAELRAAEGWWEERKRDEDFSVILARWLREYPGAISIHLEEEWGKAVNRFEREFLNEFATTDGGIDWEKLVRFNSGRDRRESLDTRELPEA